MIILGLGSNLGKREAYLREAQRRLAEVLAEMRASHVLESPALLPPGAPAQWNLPYLNMAVAGESALPAGALLAEIKKIEAAMGRQVRGVWGPREIDIDILAMGEAVVDEPMLSVPHRQLLNRPFALLPLAELAPDWRYPGSGPYRGMRAADIAAAQGFSLGVSGYARHG